MRMTDTALPEIQNMHRTRWHSQPNVGMTSKALWSFANRMIPVTTLITLTTLILLTTLTTCVSIIQVVFLIPVRSVKLLWWRAESPIWRDGQADWAEPIYWTARLSRSWGCIWHTCTDHLYRQQCRFSVGKCVNILKNCMKIQWCKSSSQSTAIIDRRCTEGTVSTPLWVSTSLGLYLLCQSI
mgnify:CR=1 FL=1